VTVSCKILLVEDDPHDVELTLTALTENHLTNEIVVVRDGAEALDYLYQRGGTNRGERRTRR
jgi:CheY-like chemotaxis protein